jgi:hypothetical protein
MSPQPNTGNPTGAPVVTGFKTVGGEPSASGFERFKQLTEKLVKVRKANQTQSGKP